MQQEDWQRLQEWDRRYVWHPFTQMQDYEQDKPIVIERGEGVYLYDIEGNRYIDGVSSLWVTVHGHCVPEIDQRISQQLTQIAHSTLLGLANVPSVELAKRLVDITPKDLCKVFYSDSGSTGVEVALKMAYQYWQQTEGEGTSKTKFAHIVNSYHGDTLGSVSVGGMSLFHKIYSRLLFETIQVDLPERYYFQGEDWADFCFSTLEETFAKHHQEMAGFIVEPLVQGAAGMLLFPQGYLKRLRALCDQYDVLLIVDEVATGFGRTGTLFACEQEAVCPDLMIMAKGLTGGYLPIAVTMTTQRVYEAFLDEYAAKKTFFHGHTYTGNPLGCAAALANLDLLSVPSFWSQLSERVAEMSCWLETIAELDYVGDVRQCGLMVGIELVKDKAKRLPWPWEDKIGDQVIRAARPKGLMIRPLGSVVVLMPPLAISKEELDTMMRIVRESIEEVTCREAALFARS